MPTQCLFNQKELQGNPKKLTKSRAQQAFTLLTLLANPRDHVALRSWCGFGSQDLRSGAWSRIRRFCAENELSLFEVTEGMQDRQFGTSGDRWIIQRLHSLKENLERFAPLTGFDLIDALFPKDDKDFAQIREALPENIDCETTTQQILELLRTNIAQPELPTDVETVRIMSLYKSKGLTADLVIVQGCIEGLLPDLSDATTDEERHLTLEEERRLFYVALTRARKYLILSSVNWLPTDSAKRMRIPVPGNPTVYKTISTRFINDLGPTCPDPIEGTKLIEHFQEFTTKFST